MSFLNAINGVARGVEELQNINNIGATLARSVIGNFDNNFVNRFLNPSNQGKPSQQPQPGQKITLNPDMQNYIPVIYGEAYASGIITDAVMSNDNLTMWYCITISEKTGNLIDGTPSVMTFKEAYFDGMRLTFQSDGVTVDLAIDEEGNTCDNYRGLIKIYPFNGDSDEPTGFSTESAQNNLSAYDLMPGWDIYDAMSELNFALVRVKYDADNAITDLKNLQFRMSNSCKDVGDVLYDYALNTRYGAGLPSTDVEVS